MAVFIAIPIIGLLLVVQSAVLSRVPLLHGTADLVLLAVVAWALQKRVQTAWQWSLIAGLWVSIYSALPLGVALVAYPLATAFALALRRRVWQVPLLAMFVATFLGTLITQATALAALRALGSPLPLVESLNLVTLPSIFLNLVLSIPAYALFSDLANWLYPEELEV